MPDQNLHAIIKQRFAELPKVLQDAITGAHVEEHMQKLSVKHALHLDKWQALENRVVLTLMGLAPAEGLRDAIKTELGLNDETADNLAEDIAIQVFEPVRQELERTLEHPDAKAEEGTPIEDMTQEILQTAKTGSAIDTLAPAEDLASIPPTPSAPVAAPPQPVTQTPPPVPKPTVTRTEAPHSYTPGQVSSQRKDIHTDPYRLPPDA